MTAREVQERLEQYHTAYTAAEMLRSRLELLDEKSHAAPITNFDGLPHGKGTTTDKTAFYAAKITDLLDELERAEDQTEKAKRSVERLINRIPPTNPNLIRQVGVLGLRYLDLLTWKDVAKGLFGTQSDFEGHEESYLRRCTKLHGAALQTLSKLIKPKEGERHA